jgi:hypothetical protein
VVVETWVDVVGAVDVIDVEVVPVVEDVADGCVVLVVVELEQETISRVVTMMHVTSMPTIPFFICPPLFDNNL